MAVTILDLEVRSPFDFKNLLAAHGWVELLPNEYHAATGTFARIEELSSGKVVQLEISAANESVKAEVRHASKLSCADTEEVRERVRHMLRLDEDFTDFYKICRRNGKPWLSMASGKGRLLRSPDLFEDILKVICTTNIQWGGTRRMVAEVVEAYGKPFPQNAALKAFPKPAAITSDPYEMFQGKTRLGYRAPFIYQLAQNFRDKPEFFTALWDFGRGTPEIRKDLLSVKGIGNYAAASVLMLLGRYDEIPVDSVFQQMMRKKYFADKDFDVKDALAIYEQWGKWKYLAYWFDLIDFY